MGARICLRGHQPYLASLAATYRAIQQVLGQVNPDDAPPVINSAILRQLTREDGYDEDADQYLK